MCELFDAFHSCPRGHLVDVLLVASQDGEELVDKDNKISTAITNNRDSPGDFLIPEKPGL